MRSIDVYIKDETEYLEYVSDILNNPESEYIGVQSIGMLEDIEKYNIRNLSALPGQSRIAPRLGVIGGIVLITGLCVGLIVFFRRKSQKARRFEK